MQTRSRAPPRRSAKSLAADAEQRGIAKKMQAKTFAAYPNVDRPQVAIRMLAGGP